MATDKKTQEFYNRLQKQLEDDTQWPALYMYKFIVPSTTNKMEEIKQLFNDLSAEIQTRNSSKGSYISVSIRVKMDSPKEVIQKYLEVSKVEGVISL